MQIDNDTMIIIDGKDKTDSITSCIASTSRYDIVYKFSAQVHHYSSANVKVLHVLQRIDPESVVFKVNGCVITPIDQILDFGEYYRIILHQGKNTSYRKTEVTLSKNCLYEPNARGLLDYYKSIAKAISLKSDTGFNILETQYNHISAVDDSTVLGKYLNPKSPMRQACHSNTLIYPFGINQSQKTAVENAFSSQISIIQGPPGTGKTQTILNIIANAVRNGNTVAVVSNNNSATQNVAEKLEKQGLSFLTAFLGSHSNKEQFLQAQTGHYPPMGSWIQPPKVITSLKQEIRILSEELTTMLELRNNISQIEQELLELKPEQFYFEEYYEKLQTESPADFSRLESFSSKKLLSLWLEYEACEGKKVGLLKRLLRTIRYGKVASQLFYSVPESAVPYLQKLFYKHRISELQKEQTSLKARLESYHFQQKMDELRKKSIVLFKAELAQRYYRRPGRLCFEKYDFRRNASDFVKEYPIILSTTYSIKGTLSPDFIYDYLVIDEASQVDLVTGVLAFSCAKNIVIVGDQKQLPNVLTPEEAKIADTFWDRSKLDERYRFTTHSILTSAAEVWPNAPSVLLKEHYRCHPKIASFFNQKFYNGELVIMTEDHGEQDVLTMYRTAPGNHARGRFNQRQIDVVKAEVLPKLLGSGLTNIGIITPYRNQAAALCRQLENHYEVSTVHKFQGREKDAIILVSVDNVIGKFVDDPNMLNVAISRAIRSLSVVISNDQRNANTNYGDLAKYIEYNNLQIIDSKVFSVFDLLYKGYQQQRIQYLKKHKRISEYVSENLAYSIIEKILNSGEFSKIGCAVHSSLATLVKDYSDFTERESQFASNPLTHVDFLLFSKMDKSPVMAIEIDGTRYHVAGSIQSERDSLKNSVLEKCGIPLLRIRTDESGEAARITATLRKAIGREESLYNEVKGEAVE